MMEIAAIILSIIALIPFCVYLWLRWFYSPKIIIRVGGDQRGAEPIKIPESGNVPFGVSTRSGLKAFIAEVWVSFNDDEVDLSKTKGAEKRITTDNQFPLAILFSEKRAVKRGYLQTNYFDYKPKGDNFSVKIGVRAETDGAELPFLLNMFPAPKVIFERIVRFKADKGTERDLKELGLAVGPGESIQSEGVQSQEAFWAVADKGIAQVKVREVIED
ncbi:MAG: hypothetical protein G01um101418_987 [Parcubacteria group bacterium Gr01-1014_18]|nr:MAG: hypothetical protein G01um101418_987 [Parcubacteria group bacterium Gr01-1014_18]